MQHENLRDSLKTLPQLSLEQLPIGSTQIGNLTGGTQQIVPIKASFLPPVRFYRSRELFGKLL
jgi:hypothetical protein